jgi:toxin CcdB
MPPQFAVYRNQHRRNRRAFPFVVDVQTDLLKELDTCVVIPLTSAPALIEFPLMHLMPTITFEGRPYVLVTPQLAGLERARLGAHVGSVAEHWHAITFAVEFLLRGF